MSRCGTSTCASTISGAKFSAVIRLLTFTTLFPNAAQPTHGIFVENRLRHLVAGGEVESRVVAPVPFFPRLLAPLDPSRALLGGVPRDETRGELRVTHPRYPVIPRIGMTVAPALLFARSLPVLRRLQAESGDFDLIDAHYFYPDGVAAVLLGKALGKPVVITARGTDVNLIPAYALPRRMILWAAKRAAHLIAVSHALKEALVALRIPAEKITVLRNGVDLAMFRPLDRVSIRTKLGLDGPVLLSVGHLIERKGHDVVIRALVSLPQHKLLICGIGPELAALEGLAREIGVDNRVRFLGQIAHDRLAEIYGAADALVLASSREGWPNVLLEAMACGTPIIASNIWGNPEIVARREAGILMRERSAAGVSAAVRDLFSALPTREATRAYAEGFSWDETTRAQIAIFRSMVAAPSPSSALAQARQ